MKQLIAAISFLILLTAFTVRTFDSHKIIQMVIALPGLDTKKMQFSLEGDMQQLSGIKFIDTSLMSNTMILHYDDRKLSINEIDHILQKWGFSPEETTFRTVLSKQ